MEQLSTIISPTIIAQVKDDFCDNPCSPDKQYCFVNACCGSRDGRYFTVAFAGQVQTKPIMKFNPFIYINRLIHARNEKQNSWTRCCSSCGS